MRLEELLEACSRLHPSAMSARVRLTNGETLEFDIEAIDYSDGIVSIITEEKDDSVYNLGYMDGKRDGIEIGHDDVDKDRAAENG